MDVGRCSRIGTCLLMALPVLIGDLVTPSAMAQRGACAANAPADGVSEALDRYVERQRRQIARRASASGRGEVQARPAWRTDDHLPAYADARSPRNSLHLQSSPEVPRFAFASGPVSNRDENAPILACSFLSFDLNELAQTTQPSAPEGDAATESSAQKRPHEQSLDEINNKLNNPGADLAQLNFKFTWNQFKGDLGKPLPRWQRWRRLRTGQPISNFLRLKRSSRREGASSQNSLAMQFQPVFPFRLADGGRIILRPTIPVVWQPHFNARSRGFDE